MTVKFTLQHCTNLGEYQDFYIHSFTEPKSLLKLVASMPR